MKALCRLVKPQRWPANGKDAVTTRNGSIEPDAFSGKTVKDIKTAYGEDNTPSMYIINYEGGGFVLVGATKNYYPILAYSDTNSINIEKAKQSGLRNTACHNT